MRIAVVGAGLAGNLVAIEAEARGWDVTLFNDPTAPRCAATAAGMLAPLAELDSAKDLVFRLGMRSLDIWPDFLARLPRPVRFLRNGSLLVAHRSDLPLLRRLIMLIERRSGRKVELLSSDEVHQLEPDLPQCHGIYLPEEAQIDTDAFLIAADLFAAEKCTQRRVKVVRCSAGTVHTGDGSETFDWVFDCRGIGAKSEVTDLRGVRGEIITVHAPEVSISRPIRLVHPRYHCYVVPRPDHVYLVGASSIEAEDLSPISVRTTLELLSALYAVQPEFAEARILETEVNLRPAFPDNEPRVEHADGLTRINGLFRHGYLLAPALVSDAVAAVAGGVMAKNPEDLHAVH
jgi:glycine oxidase